MGKGFEGLTAVQKENFEKRLRELGLNRSQVVAELQTGATPGPSYLSSHPGYSSEIKPTMLTVKTLAELRKLGGVSDELYLSGKVEEHHEIPPEWPQEKNGLKPHELTPAENRNIRQAFVVQMYGNSHRVASYEKIIESHHFPITVAAFAAEDITVDPQHPLILKGPTQVCNFGVVTIKKGGQIICQADVEMTVQKMVKEG
jgi:hypothetical protein